MRIYGILISKEPGYTKQYRCANTVHTRRPLRLPRPTAAIVGSVGVSAYRSHMSVSERCSAADTTRPERTAPTATRSPNERNHVR